MSAMWTGQAVRRSIAIAVCLAAGAYVLPDEPSAHATHRFDTVLYWGPLLAAPIVVGVLSRRDWVQRTLALTVGECLAAATTWDASITAYLIVALPVLFALINSCGVLAAAAVMGFRRGARSRTGVARG